MAPDPSLSPAPLRHRPACLPIAAACALALLLPASPVLSQGDVPRDLQPWIPWVLAEHPELGCPLVGDQRLCAWPGRLELMLDDRGGRFNLDVQADRELDLPLPGDATRWPTAVTDYGRVALMRRSGDRPAVRLAAGRHRLAGRFSWSRLPESLPVPPEIALVDLTVANRQVPFPRRQADGLLWLEGTRAEETQEDRLELDVQRRIEDGVPVGLTVRLVLRVAGRGREIDLGNPLPVSFEPTSLASDLPVRLGDGGRLLTQLRAGEWQISLHARSTGPVAKLTLAARPEPWPQGEAWVFRAEPAVRSVQIGGRPIDPQRTSLPEDWRALPAFRVGQGEELTFNELRRGETEPPPDAVTATRGWWLSQDGRRFTVQDRLIGSLHQGGRLEALSPAVLGRASLQDESDQPADQVITLAADGNAGVEVRRGELGLAADLTYPRGGALPAVGWNRDVQSLDAALHLPPGWTLLAAPGVDHADGAWVDRWSLLDLFFLLILSLATWKLYGRHWGLIAFGLLALAWHEPHATGVWLWWLVLVPLAALSRILPEGRTERLVRRLGWLAVAAFTIQLFLFCAGQFRTGLFPQLERGGRGPYPSGSGVMTEYMTTGWLAKKDRMAVDEVAEVEEPVAQRPSETPSSFEPKAYRARQQQVDPDAVVQTGPGVPRWRWTNASLRWSGPVAADHHLRLWLISPFFELLLSLLRIAGAGAIAALLLGRRPDEREPAEGGYDPPAVAAAALFLLMMMGALPALAQEPETPPRGILEELERRLTKPPDCHPGCLEVPRLALDARGDELRVSADVHAAADAAWHLPGPADVWSPSRVAVDGRSDLALRRGADGFLMLRLGEGAHRIELRGAARDSLALQFPIPPRELAWQGRGWTLTGFRPDAAPPASVRLDRQRETAEAAGGETAAVLQPWIELRRTLSIGIPWQVENELRRYGPSDSPVLAQVPLLTGESVTSPGIAVAERQAQIALERGEAVRRWRSTLDEAEGLTLIAPADRPWLERWELDCSPVWSCRGTGLPPVRHMQGGGWRPEWRPWPGEGLTLEFTRPPAAAGETATVDAADLTVTPGRRLLEGRLVLDLRSSRGGEHRLGLPAEAELQSFTVDEQPRPVMASEGGLAFTVEPGSHQVVAAWRQPHRLGLVERSPAVSLDSAAVNVRATVVVPDNRWLLWAGGPSWGPVVKMWEYVFILALAAWALGSLAPTPLTGADWFLLGVGMTQVPLAAPVIVVLWLLVLGWRERFPARRWWSYDLQQLAILGLSLLAVVFLYAAIHAGLLVRPDMQVSGAGSFGSTLHWYADRVGGDLPRPWVLWLPLWVWRILMLFWALWLASRLLRCLPWCWERFAVGPLLVGPKSFQREEDSDETI